MDEVKPEVSVIIPIYQAEAFIGRCVTTLFEQNFENIEYIFIDDASPDNSVAVLEEVIQCFPERVSRCKIIRNTENSGPFEARKTGAFLAAGHYILYVDADDWLENDMVSTMYSVAKKQEADMVVCDYYLEKIDKTVYRQQNHTMDYEKMLLSFLRGKLGPAVWNRLVKKAVALKLYDELDLYSNAKLAEDWFITLPLYCLPLNIHYVPRALYHYNRKNPNSLTTVLDISLYDDKISVLNILFDFLKPRLTERQFELLKERLSVEVCGVAFLMRRTPDFNLLRHFEFNLFCLWRTQCARLAKKIVFSFYFLKMPWIPKIIQQLRSQRAG